MTEHTSKKCHLLVVEDDEVIRDELIERLESEGYVVSSSENGTQALEVLRQIPTIDLVVLDLTLPGMDGWEFRVRQRADPKYAHIPVIVISADGTSKAAAVDAAAFLRKPFKVSLLCNEIQRILAIVERERGRALNLAQTERMASLGLLAAGVAHEINNPLTYVLSNIDYALKALSGEEISPGSIRDVREALRETRDGAERIGRIVRDLRTFTRTGEDRNEVVDLRRSLELAINISWNELRHRCKLVKHLGPAPMVEGDESRIGQVFVNLLVNAAQALDERAAERNEVRLELRTNENGYAVVEVRDNGQGIAKADLERIFDPSFARKGFAGGTGLGLAIALDTVKKCKGEITVESSEGNGATFTVVFPPWTPRATSRETDVIATPKSSVRGRILIIDDDAAVARALARGIKSEHEVQMVSSVDDAIQLLDDARPFDVIFCDVMMPLMSGIEFFNRLRASYPVSAARVVFMTGGVISPSARAFLDDVKQPRFEKPFEMNIIRAFVNERVTIRGRG